LFKASNVPVVNFKIT